MADILDAPAHTRIVRWIAIVNYRTESGVVDVQHDLEELSDLHDLVEAGPHWDTIINIDVRRSDLSFASLPVEEAAEL